MTMGATASSSEGLRDDGCARHEGEAIGDAIRLWGD